MSVSVLLIVVAGFLAIGALVVGMILLMWKLFAQYSGLNALAETYPAPQPPPGEELHRQTVVVGAVRYRRSTTVVISPSGFYFHPRAGGRPVLVPWSQFRSARAVRLYWMPAVELTVGGPVAGRVTVQQPVFERMRPYLPPECAVLG